MTFDATVNPVVYEGGIPVFIDTEYDTWNMGELPLQGISRLIQAADLLDAVIRWGRLERGCSWIFISRWLEKPEHIR